VEVALPLQHSAQRNDALVVVEQLVQALLDVGANSGGVFVMRSLYDGLHGVPSWAGEPNLRAFDGPVKPELPRSSHPTHLRLDRHARAGK
jgi:hypothetical protein